MMYQNANYPDMIVKKSEGLSQSERYLIHKCQCTFLSLWSYPNPYKKDKKGKELCDILAILKTTFLFFRTNIAYFRKRKIFKSPGIDGTNTRLKTVQNKS